MIRQALLRLVLLISCAAVVLGVVSVVGITAAVEHSGPPSSELRLAACPTPALAGSVVDVTLGDMGPMMHPGMMGHPGMPGNGPGGNSGVTNGNQWPGMGMMRLSLVPSTVPAGTISLRVHNQGMLTHEVVVFPLGPTQNPGQRPIGADRQIDETGSFAEASRSCGADEGDGILAGANAWTTMKLPAGRYELLCNIAGHYGAGMYAELDVFAPA